MTVALFFCFFMAAPGHDLAAPGHDMAAPGHDLVLSDNGKTSYTIVVDTKATSTEKYAAKELSHFLLKISGADFKVKISDNPEDVQGNLILVGPEVCEKSMGAAIGKENLGREGYIIRTKGKTLCIAGGKPRGTLYGVYDFLNYYLGCRYLTPDCTVIPKQTRLVISPIKRCFVPQLEYRATDYPNSRDADWAVRNHLNGNQAKIDKKRGGKISYSHFVHTFNSILNPAQYFKKHPEYFSEVNGKRLNGRTQLCLTNPDVLKIAKATVRRWIKESPNATIFSVSQNDWHNYCTCKKCKAIAQKEGAQSGPLLKFVNAIAKDIAKDYPDVLIDTLAYQYTRKPPLTIKPLENVTVRLCSIECCFNHPLESHPFNATFKNDIEAWNKICNRLYIWDYVIDYPNSIQPFPNLFVLKPNINFFIKNGVKGIYEEANYFSSGGEFALLRSYIIARTLWDPKYDTNKAINEFLEGYYKKAAPELRSYIDLLHKRGNNPKYTCTIWTPPVHPIYGGDFIPRSIALFNEAERKVAADPAVLFRVKTSRLPLMYLRIMRASVQGFRDKDPSFDPSVDYGKLLDSFLGIAKKAGVTRVSESSNGLLSAWASRIRPRLPKQVPIKVLLVTGYDYPGHKWKKTAPYIKKVLEKNGRLKVTITEDPESLAKKDLTPFDVIFLHFADWGDKHPSAEAQKALAKTVHSGMGLVAIHFACNAFMNWPEFVKIIGRVWDQKKTHDPYGEFKVSVTNHSHPITAGLDDFKTRDELYYCLTGNTTIKPLCYARSKVTKKDELMAYVLKYGKGKVFFSPLGHCVESLSSPGVIKLLEKACIWTAGGE